MKSPLKTFAGNVRRYRLARRDTLPALAVRAGLSKGHLSQIENAKLSPRLETMCAIAEALEVHLCDLFRPRGK